MGRDPWKSWMLVDACRPSGHRHAFPSDHRCLSCEAGDQKFDERLLLLKAGGIGRRGCKGQGVALAD